MPVSPEEYRARTALAEGFREAWGCGRPACDREPVRDDFAEEARTTLETVGAIPCRAPGEEPPPLPAWAQRCPLETIYHPDRWVSELIAAANEMAASKGGLTFAQITGREPSTFDIRGLATLRRASGDAMESDRLLAERKRQIEDAAAKAQASGRHS